MNEKDKPKLAGVVSPPYENIEIGKGLNTLPPREGRNDQSGRSAESPSQIATTYTNPKLAGVVSPPYSEQNQGTKSLHERTDGLAKRLLKDRPNTADKTGANSSGKEYSTNPNNIGNLLDKAIEEQEIDLTQFTKGELYWHGCYQGFRDWKTYITPESFAHPAKMSPKLCDKIFRHLKQSGLLQDNTTVIDFMSGIGTTNVMASLHGLNSVAVELEPHFVKMQEANRQKCKDKGISRQPSRERSRSRSKAGYRSSSV